MCSVISEQTYKLLLISKIPFVGRASINSIGGQITDWQQPAQALATQYFANLPRVTSTDISNQYIEWVDKIVAIAEREGDKIISQQDDCYPASLLNSKDAPAFLFCRGNIDLLNKPSLAVVGTRQPTEEGALLAEKVSQWFAERGWVIVSGLALGIDSVAHRACLANNGHTIAVFGTNLNKIYPADNKQLAAQIIDKDGLIVTEYPYDNKERPSQFMQRDRIQAGLSTGVVLVQSGLQGGSMHAAKAILKYDRYLLVMRQSEADQTHRSNDISANTFLCSESLGEIKKALKVAKLSEHQLLTIQDETEFNQAHEMLRTYHHEQVKW